jgi:hypothetical protein
VSAARPIRYRVMTKRHLSEVMDMVHFRLHHGVEGFDSSTAALHDQSQIIHDNVQVPVPACYAKQLTFTPMLGM